MTQVTSDSSTSLKLKLDSTFNLQNVNLNSLVSLGQITSNMDSTSLKLRGKAGLLGEMPQDSGPDGDNYYGGSGGSEYSQNNNSGDPFMRNIEMLAAQNLQSQFGGKSSLLGAAPKPKFGRNTAGLLPDPDIATNSFGYGSGNNFGNSTNNSGYGSQDNYGNGGGYYGGQVSLYIPCLLKKGEGLLNFKYCPSFHLSVLPSNRLFRINLQNYDSEVYET